MNFHSSSGEFCFFLAFIQFSFPAQQVPSCPIHSAGYAISAYASIICDFRDPFSSFLSERIATISYFSTYTLSSGNQSQHSVFHRRHTPSWRATCFPYFFHTGSAGQAHLLPYFPGHLARSCLVLNPRLVLSSFSGGIISSLFSFPNL